MQKQIDKWQKIVKFKKIFHFLFWLIEILCIGYLFFFLSVRRLPMFHDINIWLQQNGYYDSNLLLAFIGPALFLIIFCIFFNFYSIPTHLRSASRKIFLAQWEAYLLKNSFSFKKDFDDYIFECDTLEVNNMIRFQRNIDNNLKKLQKEFKSSPYYVPNIDLSIQTKLMTQDQVFQLK